MLSRYSVFDEMFDTFRNFDNLFRRGFSDVRAPYEASGSRLVPAVECLVRDNSLIVRAELPGVDPHDVEVTVEGNLLVIRGEKQMQRESDTTDYYIREIAQGRFERSFTLPEGVKADQVKASFSNGVLEVTLPVESLKAGRRVPVEVGEGAGRKQIKAA